LKSVSLKILLPFAQVTAATLWIDGMDNEQLETLATTLMKDIKQPFLA
jgi:hypothetical protein